MSESKAVKVQSPSNVVTIAGPYALIESAVASGATVETLEKLMALQERHEKNEARKQFYAAMQGFQAVKPDLKRGSKVNFSTQKGTTNYNFCSLSDIEKALKGPLGNCGLSYRFENFSEGSEIGIKCIVSHVTGHSESTAMKAPSDATGNKNSIQAIGSTSTYLMRYTLIAAFGLTTADEDNDGEHNSDLPLLSLIRHNAALRENLPVVMAIKDAVERKDYYDMAMYMDNMPEDTKMALWVAPSKGGIFTTVEIAAFKSDEYHHGKADYYAEKEAKGVSK